MSGQENYLDELLNSVNGQGKENNKENDNDNDNEIELTGTDSAFDDSVLESSLFGDSEKSSAKAEAEFIMEFEKELAGEDYEDVLKDLEEQDIEPEDRLEDADVQLTDEDVLLSMLGEGAFSDDIPDEPDLSKDYDVNPADAIDLSQMGEEELIDLLAGTDDLADIGALLSKNDSDLPVGEGDPFAEFADSEMLGGIEGIETKSEESSDGKKKGGFFDKLKTMLFGNDEEEETTPAPEPISIVTSDAPGVEFLSDENDEILKVFAEAERVETEEKGAGKDKKKDKKKIETKTKKPAKPKKQKKEKKDKKKPKEVDKTPPLPKGPVALVCVLMVSIFIFVFFGAEIIGYSMVISAAKKAYAEGEYTQAAYELTGIDIKEKDMMFHGEVATLAAVHSEVVAYETFKKNGYEAEALDCLISAAGRIEVNVDNTLTFNCEGKMTILKEGIIADLKEHYNMTYEEAITLYELTERDRDAYTIALREVMDKLDIEWE